MTLPSTKPRIIDNEPERVGAWMQDRGAGMVRSGTTCIGLERNGELIAGTLYDYFNGSSIFASVVIEGRITREWVWFIFHYPFVQLGVNVILAAIDQANVKSKRLTEHFGFTQIATIPDGAPSGDTLLYALSKDKCTWIRRPTHAA